VAESAATGGQQILPLISHLARLGRRTAEACLPGGLRPRQLIVLTLLDERGPVTQQVLGEALQLDPSNVVGLLNELEERGLVTRRRDPADRRRHIVELSAVGAGELAGATTQSRQVEDELLGALSTEERATLHDLLVRAVGVTGPACAEACSKPCRGDDGPSAQQC
jgi:DNA-binding MarR family transcriptional regulator